MRPNTFILSFSLLLSSAFLYSCGHSQAKEESKPKTTQAVGLATIHPQQDRITSNLQLPGELQAFQQVDLYAKVSSFVNRLYVDVGSEVKAGQLLASLEAPELAAQQNAAASRLKSQEALFLASQTAYDRLLQTSKTPGTVSANDLEQAFARQESNRAQLEAAKAAFREVSDTRSYLEIKAPFSGVITARNVSTGAYVGPTGKGSELPIFSLVEQQKLRLVVSVPEAYTGSIDKSGTARFTVQSLAGDTFQAQIARASGALDNRLRSQRVELDVPNQQGKLLPGMICRIQLPLKSQAPVMTVPSSAVLNSTLGVFVIRVQQNKAEWVPVIAGNSNGSLTEIAGPLSAGDLLLKTASEEIRNGQEIQVQPQP